MCSCQLAASGLIIIHLADLAPGGSLASPCSKGPDHPPGSHSHGHSRLMLPKTQKTLGSTALQYRL